MWLASCEQVSACEGDCWQADQDPHVRDLRLCLLTTAFVLGGVR